MSRTLDCHSITQLVKHQVYQSVQLGSINYCKSISPALVTVKVTTGSLERQQQDSC